MNNNLPTIPTDNEFQTLQSIARIAASSGLYSGIGSEQKIFMILLAARELGIPPISAINGGIWNIQGKIEISARLMASMIRKAGHSLVIKTISDTECVLEGKRIDNGDSFSASLCEIIQPTVEIEDQEIIDQKITKFLISYPPEDHELIKTYLIKYSVYWKKTISQSIQDYEDKEKFNTDFSKWKKKQLPE